MTKPPTDLIDRYLQAVGFWLPRAQKQDILAELTEDLHSQLEDREMELGRPLTESEVAEILRKRGRPVLVASQFLPQRSLIGENYAPVDQTSSRARGRSSGGLSIARHADKHVSDGARTVGGQARPGETSATPLPSTRA